MSVVFADMRCVNKTHGSRGRSIADSQIATHACRAEAGKLIPASNPFLRDFFHLITGPALDAEPFAGFVDDLVALLDRVDLANVHADFGRHGRRDPVVHFYETFLAAYDPALRELRGVHYTPEPVVGCIVRSIDGILKNTFGLKDGLADRAQIVTKRKAGGETVEETTHRVLILDPACGTGTFLYEVIENIRAWHERKKKSGLWSSCVAISAALVPVRQKTPKTSTFLPRFW